jgi:hypothetical protein
MKMPTKPLFLAAALGLSSATEPPVPNWGGNASHFAFSVNATFYDTADSPTHPSWNFSYYYDWNLKAERYDHSTGQGIDVCRVVNIPDGEACTVLSSSDGNLYVSSESRGCCKCVADWAPITMLPDWIGRNNGTYMGRSVEEGEEVDGWIVYGSSANKYYTSIDGEQRFVKFSDNKNGGTKQWDVIDYSGDAPKPFLFDQPDDCDVRCPKSDYGCQ